MTHPPVPTLEVVGINIELKSFIESAPVLVQNLIDSHFQDLYYKTFYSRHYFPDTIS